MITMQSFVDLAPDGPQWGHGEIVDDHGYRVHYTRGGAGNPVVCLHGWPGFCYDYRRLRPLLEPVADVVAVDLRGFGFSDKPDVQPDVYYGRTAQAGVVISLLEQLNLSPAVLVGYDIGSAVAIELARRAPELVSGLVLGNPMHPVGGRRALRPEHRGEFWYQDFHRLPLATELMDGDRDQVKTYLRHFYDHWTGLAQSLRPAEFSAIVDVYSEPGAFTASLNWYRAGAATVAATIASMGQPAPEPVWVAAEVLWAARDPVFTLPFAAGLDATLPRHRFTPLPDIGHFVPVEAPAEVADAVRRLL